MLANDLAKAVADFGAAVVSISRLRRDLARLPLRLRRLADRTDLFDRTDADAVRLAQCPVDRPGLGDSHLGPANQRGDVGRIGIAVADEPLACSGPVDGCSECPA